MEWKKMTIGECIQCNPSVKLTRGEEYPIIDIDKISVGRKFVTNRETLVYAGQGGSKFQNGDTLMARITPCLENGKMAQAKIKDKGIGSTELFVFRGLEDVTDNDFVYYFFKQQYIREYAANSMTGASGRQRADLNFIKKIQFDLPPLPVQQKIASILSTYDTLIENNNKRIKILEQMAENLYKEWFVRFRFPGYKNTPMFNGLPKGWKRTKIGDIYTTCSGGTPNRAKEEYYQEGDVPWVKTGEIQDTVILETEERITDDAIRHSSAKMLPKGSLLMAMYGVNIGKLGILSKPMTCNQAACVFLPDSNTLYYLFYQLMSLREYLLLIGFGAAQQNLSQALIKNIRIVVPDNKTLNQFEGKVTVLYRQIENLKHQNTKLAHQRDLLLPRLMSGKLEVTP